MKVKGNVKWFSKSKEYGFITNKIGGDVFFRIENISKSTDPLDLEVKKIVPENGDFVEYTEYEHKEQLRAKKIVIIQRVNSVFVCPYCNEQSKQKVIFKQRTKKLKIGQEFEEQKPMHSICSNCFSVLDTFETIDDEYSMYNRAAMLLLVLLMLTIFVKYNLL